jgi:hypothetical protein
MQGLRSVPGFYIAVSTLVHVSWRGAQDPSNVLQPVWEVSGAGQAWVTQEAGAVTY